MSWHDITPPTESGGAKRKMPCTIGLWIRSTSAPKLRIIWRRDQFDCPAWLIAGRAVTVQFGTGDHAGWLRVTPGGNHTLRQSGGRAKKDHPALFLEPLPGSSTQRHSPQQIPEFRASPDAVEMKLPDWARNTAIAGPRAAVAPFRTMATRDTHAAARGA